MCDDINSINTMVGHKRVTVGFSNTTGSNGMSIYYYYFYYYYLYMDYRLPCACISYLEGFYRDMNRILHFLLH